MSILSGEKFEDIADIVIATNELISFHKSFNYNRLKVINMDNFSKQPISIPYKTVYVNTNHLIRFFSEMIDYFPNAFILLCHNSDQEIDESYSYIVNHPKVISMFTQNCIINHNKAVPVPIGLANLMWDHGNQQAFNQSNISSSKSKLCYFNFSIHNHPSRSITYNKLKNKLVWTERTNYISYIKELSQYKFCICPRGNGTDTHRFWECILVDVIPIVLDSEFTIPFYLTGITIIKVKNWDDVSTSYLESIEIPTNFTQNKKLMDINYYKSIFNT